MGSLIILIYLLILSTKLRMHKQTQLAGKKILPPPMVAVVRREKERKKEEKERSLSGCWGGVLGVDEIKKDGIFMKKYYYHCKKTKKTTQQCFSLLNNRVT